MSSTVGADPSDQLLDVRGLRRRARDLARGGPSCPVGGPRPAAGLRPRVEAMAGLMAALFDAGWGRYGWPAEVGGLGGTMAHRAAMWEALARHGVPGMALFEHLEILAPTLVALGPRPFVAQALPAFLAGRELWAQGFSEPDAGSDLASLRTSARRDGDGFVIDGRKIWTSWARYATWCLVLARTGTREERHRGLTAFIVDLRAPGVEVSPIEQANGTDELAEVVFDERARPRRPHRRRARRRVGRGHAHPEPRAGHVRLVPPLLHVPAAPRDRRARLGPQRPAPRRGAARPRRRHRDRPRRRGHARRGRDARPEGRLHQAPPVRGRAGGAGLRPRRRPGAGRRAADPGGRARAARSTCSPGSSPCTAARSRCSSTRSPSRSCGCRDLRPRPGRRLPHDRRARPCAARQGAAALGRARVVGPPPPPRRRRRPRRRCSPRSGRRAASSPDPRRSAASSPSRSSRAPPSRRARSWPPSRASAPAGARCGSSSATSTGATSCSTSPAAAWPSSTSTRSSCARSRCRAGPSCTRCRSTSRRTRWCVAEDAAARARARSHLPRSGGRRVGDARRRRARRRPGRRPRRPPRAVRQADRHVPGGPAPPGVGQDRLHRARQRDPQGGAPARRRPPERYGEVVKALAGRNGRRACERSLQVLGGIGFTAEHAHHHHHSRVLLLDSLLGTSAELSHDLGAWLRTTGTTRLRQSSPPRRHPLRTVMTAARARRRRLGRRRRTRGVLPWRRSGHLAPASTSGRRCTRPPSTRVAGS